MSEPTQPIDPKLVVRTLTGLTALDVPDEQLDVLLDLNDGHLRLTAADALEAAAGQLTSVTSDDISIDGSKRAAVLMARAARFRELVAKTAAEDDFAFEVVDSSCGRPELTEQVSG